MLRGRFPRAGLLDIVFLNPSTGFIDRRSVRAPVRTERRSTPPPMGASSGEKSR